MSLKIENLSFRIGNQWILRDVDLDAASGQIFGICGATGSGKTSLLKAIAGEIALSSGSIFSGSNDVTALGKARGIDLLTEPVSSGFKINLLSAKSIESRGQSQRDAFERFLQTTSKIILLDDPFSRVDNEVRNDLIAKLKSWLTPDRTVIFASSSFEQLAPVVSQMLVIANGYAKQSGTPQRVYECPETVAVATLTGSVNLIRARRVSSSDAEFPEFQTLDGGHQILSRPTPKSRLGPLNKDSTLLIRPEQITMSMGASFPEDNLLRAVVTKIQFEGSTSLIEFDAGGLMLTSRVFKIVGLDPGQECMLGLPPDRIVVLKD